MRKHGWQLPYHPLQVVAVAVFLALGFAYYVFFAPFLGKKLFQYISMGIYTPLIICVFSLYIWSAAADPADPGVFKSKKYLKIPENKKLSHYKKSNIGEESPSSLQYDDCATAGGKSASKSQKGEFGQNIKAPSHSCWMKAILGFIPCALICQCSSSNGESSEYPHSEDGMFYCSLCEVEVSKYSKHCRVCDKCVHSFDHHCRWVNNCIGKRNYHQFFALMVSALLMLILQWSTGILVLICCFLKHKKFSLEISTNLGSSFTIVPFVVVVAVCTILAMIATLPIAQLFFFHILLIKKGISTYDYIIALREQEQQGVGGQQSPSMVSSITGISSASSVNTFQRGAWCTPPRLFLEDQFDVVPPDMGSVSSWGKKMAPEKEPIKKKNPAAVKISPWTLARLNADEVSKAAAEARKKSKILIPVSKRGSPFVAQTESTFNNNHPMGIPKPERHFHKNTRNVFIPEASSSLAPLQAMNSSPDSSLESPRHLPFRVSSSGAEEARQLSVSRSASDGYDASGGEDSDRVPSRPVLRVSNWGNVLFHPNRDERVASSSQMNGRKF